MVAVAAESGGSWTVYGAGFDGALPAEALAAEAFAMRGGVTGVDGVRFVAAVGIVDGGRKLGVVAAMSAEERDFRPEQRQALEDLAAVAGAVLANSHRRRWMEAAHPALGDRVREHLRSACERLGLAGGALLDIGGAARWSHGENSGAFSISAPVDAGQERFGELVFRSPRELTASDRAAVEQAGREIGHALFEHRLAEELERRAQCDPLTGLVNRMEFTRRLEAALEQATATGAPLAIGFIDLDRFKQVNDTLGHATGDEVLREAAARLGAEAGPDELVARVGGDEFTVLFSGNPTRSSVAMTAERMIEALRRPYRIEGSELFITASMGISFFPEDAGDPRQLLQKADAAMYRCKGQGKNDFRFFTPDIVLRGARRMELETELRRALEREELRMSYMPLAEARSGKLASFEALLAWRNPRFGNVGPARFIPIAEESGMIIPIGTWVLNEVCRVVGGWRKRGLETPRVAVNVSGLQFSRPDFVGLVERALRDGGARPQSLELELTESMLMRDMETAARRMLEIRELGVSIAIDDFGTGYSSLSYLRRLPVDALKIDQSFVAELGSSGSALPLIHTIVALAHNIGLNVVAEGVETREQMELLSAAGCDKLQGRLFGAPMSAEGAEALMARPERDVPIRS